MLNACSADSAHQFDTTSPVCFQYVMASTATSVCTGKRSVCTFATFRFGIQKSEDEGEKIVPSFGSIGLSLDINSEPRERESSFLHFFGQTGLTITMT